MIGTLLANRYAVSTLLHDGPIFATYAARDMSQGREVCVRLIQSPVDREPSFVIALEETVQKYRAIQSPNLEPISRCISENGVSFLVGDSDSEELGSWWHEHRTASAIVALNEEAALAILAAAQRDHISIPDQLSLITYDSTLTCDATRPRLSAVFQPLADMAASATKMLIHAASAQPSSLEELPATIHYFPARLDLRESTARPYPITQN